MSPQPLNKVPDSNEDEIKKRKRDQNRLAQRTYRRNQKQRLQNLERAVGKATSGATRCSVAATNNCSQEQERNGTSSGSATESFIDQSLSIAPFLISTGATNVQEDPLDNLSWNFGSVQTDISPISEFPMVGQPALHRAICSGNESIIRLLLEKGADTTKLDKSGQSVLHIAVENSQEHLVQILLDSDIDPNITDSLGRTALFIAIQSENENVVKLLLDAEVDVNWKDSLGDVALHLAIERGSESLTRLLLVYGADVNA